MTLSLEMLIGRLPSQPLNPASKVSLKSVGRQQSIRDRVRNHQVSTSEKEQQYPPTPEEVDLFSALQSATPAGHRHHWCLTPLHTYICPACLLTFSYLDSLHFHWSLKAQLHPMPTCLWDSPRAHGYASHTQA